MDVIGLKTLPVLDGAPLARKPARKLGYVGIESGYIGSNGADVGEKQTMLARRPAWSWSWSQHTVLG
jgi:hypothetical protein